MSISTAFPTKLDMEEAYCLLSEKTEIYYKYKKAGDKENANRQLQLCNDIAKFYNLLFVIESSDASKIKLETEEKQNRSALIVQKIDEYLSASKKAQQALQECIVLSAQHNLNLDFTNLATSRATLLKEAQSFKPQKQVVEFENFEDYQAHQEHMYAVAEWYSSGCHDYEEWSWDMDYYFEQVSGEYE